MAPKKARKKKIAAKRPAWNKGLKIGKKDALTPEQVKRIRGVLAKRNALGHRDLALFSAAIDTAGSTRTACSGHAGSKRFDPFNRQSLTEKGRTAGPLRSFQTDDEGG